MTQIIARPAGRTVAVQTRKKAELKPPARPRAADSTAGDALINTCAVKPRPAVHKWQSADRSMKSERKL
eukprot:4494579-Pleurochrysis_carterae.AAC.2